MPRAIVSDTMQNIYASSTGRFTLAMHKRKSTGSHAATYTAPHLAIFPPNMNSAADGVHVFMDARYVLPTHLKHGIHSGTVFYELYVP